MTPPFQSNLKLQSLTLQLQILTKLRLNKTNSLSFDVKSMTQPLMLRSSLCQSHGNFWEHLKELRNFILCIIRVWLLFCSIRVYISLHFLPRFSSFCVLVFLLSYLWLSIFSFGLCFELNIFLKDFKTFYSQGI